MDKEKKSLEFKVGLFVFIGLVVIGAMVAKFGRIGQGFANFYPLTVDFADSGGLIRNADVQLAGARIGYVQEKPVVRADMSGVRVAINIQERVKIPRASKFQIGSTGLLGDKYVEIVPAENFDPKKFNPDDSSQVFQPGDNIKGAPASTLAEMQKKGEAVLDALNTELGELKKATDTLNTKVLNDENTGNVTTTIANLHKTSNNIADASVKIKTVLDDTQTAVDSAKKTMATTDSAAAELKLAIGDTRKVVEGVQTLVSNANSGQGAVATLLNDRQFADNLKTLISNLREHGVLFYRDMPDQNKKPAAKPRR